MKPQYHAPAVTLLVIMILASPQLHSQGKDVDVHFTNDSTRSAKLLSVGDTSIVIQIPEYQWDPRFQVVSVSHIRAISFTETVPGDASGLAKVGATVGGVIIGAVAGGALGAWAEPPRSGLISFPSYTIFGTLVGSIAGGYLGAELVNPSTSREIWLVPKVPEHRDSLRVYLGTQ